MLTRISKMFRVRNSNIETVAFFKKSFVWHESFLEFMKCLGWEVDEHNGKVMRPGREDESKKDDAPAIDASPREQICGKYYSSFFEQHIRYYVPPFHPETDETSTLESINFVMHFSTDALIMMIDAINEILIQDLYASFIFVWETATWICTHDNFEINGSFELNVYSVVNPIDMYIKANKIEGDTTFLTSLFEKLHERLATLSKDFEK